MTRTLEYDAHQTAGGVAWLDALRASAGRDFEAQGYPTAKWEEWRHTNVSAIAATTFTRPSAGADAIAPEQVPAFALCPLASTRIVFVNGRYAPALSQTDGLPDGVSVLSIAETIRSEPDRLEPFLGRAAATGTHPFAALNTAQFEDGAFVHVGRGRTVREPIVLLHLSTSPSEADGPAVSYPRNLVVAGEGSVASVIEVFAGVGGGRYLTNAVTEFHVDEGASLDHVKVQRESPAAYHIAGMAVRQAARSNFSSHSITLGAALTRNDIHMRLGGPGGESTLNGLVVGDGDRHADNHTVIEHAAEHCDSRETFHTILSGASKGVFAGKIIVRPDAQKTDARQSSRNLLLSRESVAEAMPQLEIFADDVKCTHGATVGCLDEEAVFYLRTRGVPETAARGLLTYAFANEILASIRVEALRERLQRRLFERLTGGEDLG